MKDLNSLSVLCLAYNEEENVRWAIPRLVTISESLTDDYEIVVVTNAQSRDRTNELLEDFAAANPRIRPVPQPAHVRGYGPAFAFGLRQLRKEWAFHTDVDGQFMFEDVFRAVRVQQETNADLVHFNRRRRKDPWERKVIGFVFKMLVHGLYRCPVWDFDSGFNLFRTSFLPSIEIQSDSGVVLPEFLIKFAGTGARIKTGWTEHQPRRAGKPAWEVPWRGIILPDAGIVKANLADLWRLRYRLRRRAPPQ